MLLRTVVMVLASSISGRQFPLLTPNLAVRVCVGHTSRKRKTTGWNGKAIDRGHLGRTIDILEDWETENRVGVVMGYMQRCWEWCTCAVVPHGMGGCSKHFSAALCPRSGTSQYFHY